MRQLHTGGVGRSPPHLSTTKTHYAKAIQFSETFCRFCGINRDREVAPTARYRDSEIPPTEKLNDPTHYASHDPSPRSFSPKGVNSAVLPW